MKAKVIEYMTILLKINITKKYFDYFDDKVGDKMKSWLVKYKRVSKLLSSKSWCRAWDSNPEPND